MRRQRSFLFCGLAIKGWGCQGRLDRITYDGVDTTMSMPKLLPVWQHVHDVLITNLTVRVAMLAMMSSKGGGDERWRSKPKKFEVAEETKMIRSVWYVV